MQQTLGIVHFDTKSDLISNIKNDDLKIIAEKMFELSIEAAAGILNKEGISEPQLVFGFILEGMNAIQDWLNIISTSYSTKSLIHGSLNPDNAQKEIDWFQTLSDSSLSSKSSSSSSSIPVMVNTATATNKKNLLKKPATMAKSTTKGGTVSGTSPHQRKRDTTSADEPRLRKPLTTNNTVVRSKIPPPSNTVKSRTLSPMTNKKSNTTNITPTKPRVAVSANTNTTSTSRRADINTRRRSLVTATTNIDSTAKKFKLTEKRPIGATIKPKTEIPVVDTKKEEKQDDALVTEPVAEKIDNIQPETVLVEETKEQTWEDEAIAFVDHSIEKTTEPEQLENVIETNEEDDITTHTNVLTQQPVSHPSTCSSSADEHDAEVAATISNTNKNTNTVKVAANFFQNSAGGRSSSFSPNSVSSLPRPETPEVDQLRQRFETLIQTSAPNTPHDHIPNSRRPSSKMSSEYIISRIKEMKPKDPVGSKVKSMVELFMDENLNKWEF
ncbi:unnamed protein product [Mucor hiemalis]